MRYSFTAGIIIVAAIGLLLIIRFGVAQNSAARNVTPRSGSSSVLAVIAFILAFPVPPVGVAIGHISLYRIGIGAATGRHLADAALWVGYFLLALEFAAVLIAYSSNSWL